MYFLFCDYVNWYIHIRYGECFKQVKASAKFSNIVAFVVVKLARINDEDLRLPPEEKNNTECLLRVKMSHDHIFLTSHPCLICK